MDVRNDASIDTRHSVAALGAHGVDRVLIRLVGQAVRIVNQAIVTRSDRTRIDGGWSDDEVTAQGVIGRNTGWRGTREVSGDEVSSHRRGRGALEENEALAKGRGDRAGAVIPALHEDVACREVGRAGEGDGVVIETADDIARDFHIRRASEREITRDVNGARRVTRGEGCARSDGKVTANVRRAGQLGTGGDGEITGDGQQRGA